MTKFKRAITACILSTLILSSIALPVFAVDEVDKADTSVDIASMVETEDVNTDSGGTPDDTPSETATTIEPDDNTAEEPIDEPADDTIDTSVDESSVQTSEPSVDQSTVSQAEPSTQVSEPQTSETSKAEIKTGKQTIRITLNLVTNLGQLGYTEQQGFIDFSNVSVTLYGSDKSSVIKHFSMEEILVHGYHETGTDLLVEVPDWGKNGIVYYLRVDNLPDIFKSSSQEFPIECVVVDKDEEITPYRGDPFTTHITSVSGVDTAIYCELSVKSFQNILFVYDMNDKPADNVSINIGGYNSDNQLIYSKIVKTNKYGYTTFDGLTEDIKQLKFSSESVINGGYITGQKKYDYDYEAAQLGINKYILQADTSYEETLLDDTGKLPSSVVSVPFTLTYNNSNLDTMLFKQETISVSVFNGETIAQTISLGSDNSSNVLLSKGAKYTVKADSITYNVSVNPVTLTVTDNAKVSLTATPQQSLTVINEENGVANNAHFKIVDYDKEFNEKSHKFAVNNDSYITVVNLDTDEHFEIIISNYRETVINIATGEVTQNGLIVSSGSPTSTTSSGSSASNNITTVPKTGDMILGIALTLCGLTAISYVGYEYYKRKGKKHNEAKK